MKFWSLDSSDKRGVVAGAVMVLLIFAGMLAYYLWRDRGDVAAVRVVSSAGDVADCALVSKFVVAVGNPGDNKRNVATTILATEDALRRMAAAAGADTVLFTGGGVVAEAAAYRCKTRP